MVPCARWPGTLLVLVLLALACTGGQAADAPSASPAGDGDPAATASAGPADPVTIGSSVAFSTYRAGIVQGDADAVLASVTEASLAQQAEIVELARTADAEAIRALPAAQQLLVLTYRLRPTLLEAEDPYAALVDAGLAGQDRSLGELGDVEQVDDTTALGEVLDNQTLRPTPLRWRFELEDGEWRVDLVTAQSLVSQAIAAAARRGDIGVDEIVTDTLVDLSGEDRATIEALYAEPPAA